MDEQKILLVNLSKGRTGELNSKLLGMMFVMKFQAAAMSRSDIPESERKDFALYVDEFQNFSTDSFATILSEARKYHLNLIVANQFTTQLTEEIRDAVFGNIGTVVSFRIGQNDVEALSRYFQPQFDGDDLLRIPNANTVVRTLVNGVPTQPFSMATLPPLGKPNMQLVSALKQLTAAKYGKLKAVVEKEIFNRLETKPAPRPFSNPFNAPANAPASQVQPRPLPPQPPSFLDEWLHKQKQQTKGGQPSQPGQPVQPQTPDSPPTQGQQPPNLGPAGYLGSHQAQTGQSGAVQPSPTMYASTTSTPTASPNAAAGFSLQKQPQLPYIPSADAGGYDSYSGLTMQPSAVQTAESSSVAAQLGGGTEGQRKPPQTLRSENEGSISLKDEANSAEDTIYIDKDGQVRSDQPK